MIAWSPLWYGGTRQFGIDWSPMLADGATISTVVIVRDAGTVDLTGQTQDGNRTIVTASGGAAGQASKFTATMTASDGTVWPQVIWLPVVSSACDDYQPSTIDKRTVVEMAYEDIGLPGYEFAGTPEELFSAIRRLDAMMREWPCGQALGYNFPSQMGGSDPDDPVLVPDWAITAMVGKLAQKIAPGQGKTLSSEQKAATASAYSQLLGRLPVPEVRYPRSTPRGAGNRWLAPWQVYIVSANCCSV